jgi:imidazolonepropionase
MELLIHDIAEVATPLGDSPLAGADQRRVRRTENQQVLCRDGRIVFVGNADDLRARFGELPAAERLDGRGRTLVPGFVDCHTHLPWAGSREHELAARLAGQSYQQIAASGGGILSTVAATRAASEEELAANVCARLDRMLDHGTTTAEAKSGYGLSLAAELKQLRAIRRAAGQHVVDLVPTLMAAHEVPAEHRGSAAARERFLDEICREITPAAAEAGLARFCDVFCEQGVFSVDESRRVLQAGIDHGLLPRLHADEFVDSGAAGLAAELGAISADHLVAVSDSGIAAMAAAGVMAVMLPGVSFFLQKADYAPARKLVEAGVPVAISTDCNPGSSHSESLPFMVWLGVFELGMTIEECLTAITLNPACCLGRGEEIGSVEEGKQADLVLLDAPNLFNLAYHFGVNPVAAVVKNGRMVRGAS